LKKGALHRSIVLRPWNDFLHLLYPEICVSCGEELTENEGYICSICDASLTETSFHLFTEPSPFDKLFWGRTDVASTFALYQFQKKSPIQSLLFQFKYKHTEKIGRVFGQRIGERIKASEKYAGIECLIPVPLHPKKAFVRGYNQSLALAQGISETTGKPVNSNLIQRSRHTSTQTKKDRFDRWENVASAFVVHPRIKDHAHIALVDDVVTTGSTLEAMALAIREVHPDIQISVLTLAIA
jgi:ComF family protein